jgi:hypothetical protein
MRTFDDTHGNVWQAALLEASYGNIALLFTPMRGDGIRRCEMPADDMAEAEAQLSKLDDDGMRMMLAQAEPWRPGVDGS